MDYALALKTDRMAAVIARLDAAVAPGVLVIGTAGMAVELVRLTLSRPAGAAAAGVATFAAIGVPALPPLVGEILASGTAAAAEFRDGDDVAWVTDLDVGLDDTFDVTLDRASLALVAGDSLSLAQVAITHHGVA